MSVRVVMVHGLRTSATMWRLQRERLEALGARVVTPDLPGHGARMSERFTVDAALATIDDAVDEAGGGAHLVGFSLGGYLSIHYAALGRRNLASVIAASCGTQPNRVVLGGWRALAAVIRRFPDRGLALNNAAVSAVIRDPQLARDVIAGGVALDVMDDVLRGFSVIRVADSLSSIDVPVTFINGTLDHFRIHERRFLRAAPVGSLELIPGATHMVSLAAPDAFARILRSRLELP